MKPVATTSINDKKGHVCPPSNATHPADRWETAFVYAFIVKFTQLRGKVEGFESPVDLEDALLSPTQHPVLIHILSRFVLNLRPQTRNTSADQISYTVSSVLQEYMKSSERTLFWDDTQKSNVDPLQGIEGGFWGADWDLKLRVLRQLVEFQLSHHADTRDTIDRAWGVVHNKHKKKDGTTVPLDAADPHSVERLSTVPIGQDCQRKRYWVVDDSPRLYVSTNPWKITAGFKTVATTKIEYLQAIEDLKKIGPSEAKEGEKKSKIEIAHIALIKALESRLEVIDAELLRVQKVRRKIEQREILMAQAEVRETRTRRQTRRPDYVYQNDDDSDDDGGDEYTFQEDEDDEDHIDDDFHSDTAGPSSRNIGRRRSQRSATLNANGKRAAVDAYGEWRGERRSTRLGTNPDLQAPEPPVKRARTDERSVSLDPSDAPSQSSDAKSLGTVIKKEGAAAVKPNEIALEQVAGKKKSKFWFYAVEPAHPPPGSSVQHLPPTNGGALNGHHGNNDNNHNDDGGSGHMVNGNGGAYNPSLSPAINNVSVPGAPAEPNGWFSVKP